jgi:hypothetical protein
MQTTNQPLLGTEEVAEYNREGFLVYNKPVLPVDEFEALKEHFEKLLDQWPEEERPESMDVPHFTDTALFRWALSDAVLDLVEPILGPDILLFSTHFICKPKGDGRRVPWHEDSAYWRNMLDPMEVVTVWLALDPSLEENGCMKVVPRTHQTGQKGFSDYEDADMSKNVLNQEIIKLRGKDAAENEVLCQLQPNECSLHDSRLIHGSKPNTSPLRRCGWTLRFARGDVKLNPDLANCHNMYLARGRNVTGQPLADPSRTYPELLVAGRKSRGGH